MHLAPKSMLDERVLARMDLEKLLQEYETRFGGDKWGKPTEPRTKLRLQIRNAARRYWSNADLDVLEDVDNQALLIQSPGNSKNPIFLVLSSKNRTVREDKAALNVWFTKRIDSQQETIGPYHVRSYVTGLDAIPRRSALKFLAGLLGLGTLRYLWNTFEPAGPSADVIGVYGMHGDPGEFPKGDLEKQTRAMDKELAAVPRNSQDNPKAVYVTEMVITAADCLKLFRKKYPQYARLTNTEILENKYLRTKLKETYDAVLIAVEEQMEERFMQDSVNMNNAKYALDYFIGWAKARKVVTAMEHASFESWIETELSLVSDGVQLISKKDYEGFLREVFRQNNTRANSYAMRDMDLHEEVLRLRVKYPGYVIFFTRGYSHLLTRRPFEKTSFKFKFYNTSPDYLETTEHWFLSELLNGKKKSESDRKRLSIRFLIRNFTEGALESYAARTGGKIFTQSRARKLASDIVDAVENRVPNLEEYFKGHFLASDSPRSLNERVFQSFIQLGIINPDPLQRDWTKSLVGGFIATPTSGFNWQAWQYHEESLAGSL